MDLEPRRTFDELMRIETGEVEAIHTGPNAIHYQHKQLEAPKHKTSKGPRKWAWIVLSITMFGIVGITGASVAIWVNGWWFIYLPLAFGLYCCWKMLRWSVSIEDSYNPKRGRARHAKSRH